MPSIRSRCFALLFLVFPVSLINGCGSNDPGPPPPPTMTGDIALTADAQEPQSEVRASGERQAFDGLEFNVPADWKEVQSEFQGIVSAKFTMPQKAADVTLTLSRSGGGLEANLDRWRGQIRQQTRPENVETIRVAETDATWIDLEGTYTDGFRNTTHTGWRMLGVIVPLPDRGYFLKVMGPADQVELIKEEFRAFVKSAAKE